MTLLAAVLAWDSVPVHTGWGVGQRMADMVSVPVVQLALALGLLIGAYGLSRVRGSMEGMGLAAGGTIIVPWGRLSQAADAVGVSAVSCVTLPTVVVTGLFIVALTQAWREPGNVST